MNRTFTDWIRYFMANPYPDFDYATYVDKHKAKNVVKGVIAHAKEFAYFDSPEQVDAFDWSKLPLAYVIKATHGCKWQIIKKSNAALNKENAVAQMKSWLNQYFRANIEKQYGLVTPGVLIEAYLGDNPKEYKLWYIHGELQFIEARDPFSEKRSHFDTNWKRLAHQRKNHPQPIDLPKPANLAQVIDKGNKLVQLINNPPFVRIDIYNIQRKTCCTTNNDLYFCEYTFTPASGTNPFIPYEFEIIFGNKISAGL